MPGDHWKADIPIGRPRRGPVEDAPVGGAMEPDVLRELLAAEESSPGGGTSKKAKTGYRSVTNEPLPPPTGNDQPFVRNPLAPAGRARRIGSSAARESGSPAFEGPSGFLRGWRVAAFEDGAQ